MKLLFESRCEFLYQISCIVIATNLVRMFGVDAGVILFQIMSVHCGVYLQLAMNMQSITVSRVQ